LAKKKKVEKPRQELTKRQLSHWKKHQRRQRIIVGLGILVIAAVLVVIGAGVYFGWYVPDVKPLGETVIRVNDTEFDMAYYVDTLKYQVVQLESMGLSIDISQMTYLAEGAVTAIQINELVRQEALEMGFSVSDEELEARVEEELSGYDPSMFKEYREVIRDLIRSQMLREQLLEGYFDQQVPLSAEQRHVMAIFLESRSQAEEVRERLEAGELFSEITAELCLDSNCKSREGDLGWHPRGILPLMIDSSVLEDSAFSTEVRSLSQPIYEKDKTKNLGYWLIEVEFIDEEVEHAELKVLLLGSEEEALEVRARLEGGEDFAALAAEVSQHEESKGEGGEFVIDAKGLFADAFDEFVFNPETLPGTISQPIKDETVVTAGGYWLVKVVDAAEDRQVTDEDRDILKSDLLNKWTDTLPYNPYNVVESYLDEEKTSWAILRVLEG